MATKLGGKDSQQTASLFGTFEKRVIERTVRILHYY
jgi:hypothetical protein